MFFDGFEEFGAVLINWEGFTSFVDALSYIRSEMLARLSKLIIMGERRGSYLVALPRQSVAATVCRLRSNSPPQPTLGP